ncbi:low-density lipoprotein receptor-related protein 1B [Halyomorpha halys]|uniref:low-density lipoprotein receptor-related protein 1B n=1 Tax=Halyomorpha halys TaxID=286706 RepID=UPI0006D4CD8A|nr:low-density lipoprotein receptor-related protein 2-like [Halyomorpha halys]
MKYLLVLWMVTVVEVVRAQDMTPLSSRWDKLVEFDQKYKEYSKTARDVIKEAMTTISDIRSSAVSFIEQFFNTSTELLLARNFTNNTCSRPVFNYVNIKNDFFTHITRAERPLLAHISELEEKLTEINSTIKISYDVAESNYLSCALSHETCMDSINIWLGDQIKSIACRLRHCQDKKKREKRLASLCETDEFTCNNRRCIKRTWICDGQFDCADGSDEPPECVQKCREGFHCFRTLRCIDRSLICNDFNDCGDRSDELHCGSIIKKNNASYCSIENGRFKCSQDLCIGIHQVCDGKKDCEDGKDETDLCDNGKCPDECVSNGGACFFGPQGPLCFSECPLGTFEAPGGCSTHPYLYNSTVFDLLEGIPAMTTRHNRRFGYIKMKTLYSFAIQVADVIKCQLGTLSEKDFTL